MPYNLSSLYKEDIMEVTQYTYLSPYTSPVQFGRPDASSQKQENSSQESTNTQELPKSTNESLTEAQEFSASQTQEVKPSVTTNNLDLYA